VSSIGTIIDGLVAILLCLTIGYCVLLNRRLKLLKSDEQSLRATISELVTATEIAERAIAGLKLTVRDCDLGLGERVRSAERLTIELDRGLVAGREVLNRLSRIATAGRIPNEPPPPNSDALDVAAAAQAFAERLRTKSHGLAA
jgi:Domain of unknown function (DUF6468)